MSKFLRILGRILFALLLIYSSYHRLTNPQLFIHRFSQSYTIIRTLNQYFSIVPSINDLPKYIQLTDAVRAVGLLQLIIGILIILGKSIGGIIFCIYLLGQFLSKYAQACLAALEKRSLLPLIPILPSLLSWFGSVGSGLILSSQFKKDKIYYKKQQ